MHISLDLQKFEIRKSKSETDALLLNHSIFSKEILFCERSPPKQNLEANTKTTKNRDIPLLGVPKLMAFVLPNLSPLLQLQFKDKPTIHHYQSSIPTKPIPSISSPVTKLLDSPPNRVGQVTQAPPGGQKHQDDDFYVNLGLAVRTLREDMPLLFSKDLNYGIYRYPFC